MWGSAPESGTHGEPVATVVPTLIVTALIVAIAAGRWFLTTLLHKIRQPSRHPHHHGKPKAAPLSPPRSPDSIHLSSRHPRSHTGPSTPVTSAVRYGLAVGEAAAVEEDWEEEGDDLTARELRRLQASPDFKKWCHNKRVNADDLERTSSRLQVYRSLQRVHPASFWALCTAHSRRGTDSRPPSFLTLVIEYIASVAVTAGAAYLAAYPWLHGNVPAPVAVLCGGFAWWATARQWLAGRPTLGPVFNLWYEDVEYGHAVAAWRALAANILEAGYVAGTLGVGALISIAMRVRGERQSVGERLAGVRAVQEVTVALDDA